MLDRVTVQQGAIEVCLMMPESSGELGTDDLTPPNENVIRVVWSPPVSRRRRDILLPEGAEAGIRPMHDSVRANILRAVAKARSWLDEIVAGSVTIEEVAAREGCSERSARMALSLAFLAPDIVQAALDGRLPRGIGVSRLADPPIDWREQNSALGLPAHPT